VVKKVGTFTLLALAVSLALAVLVSPFASSRPDGLERVAEDGGFADRADGAALWRASPVRDYAVPGLSGDTGESKLAVAAAGLLGTLGVFLAALAAARLIRSRRRAPARAAPRPEVSASEAAGPPDGQAPAPPGRGDAP